MIERNLENYTDSKLKEKHFQTKFKHFLQKNWSDTGAFELKIEKAKSMRFDKVRPHQLRALYNAKHGKKYNYNLSHARNNRLTHLYWKIHDSSYMRKPCDCVYLVHVPAYVVIWFYHPRQPKKLIMIDVDDFIKAKWKNRPRKSLKEHEWEKIGKIFPFK